MDGNGNIRAISDQTGAVVERYDYDAFGTLRNTPSGAVNDRRYTGEQYDAETGYTFLRARYYDPGLGRFISQDGFPGAAQEPQSLNRYSYTQNNPCSRTDPSGKVAVNPNQDPPCVRMKKAIDRFVKELQDRWDALDIDRCLLWIIARTEDRALPEGRADGCKGSWAGHQDQYKGWQKGLGDRVEEYDKYEKQNGPCPDQISDEARGWTTKTAPPKPNWAPSVNDVPDGGFPPILIPPIPGPAGGYEEVPPVVPICEPNCN